MAYNLGLSDVFFEKEEVRAVGGRGKSYLVILGALR